jgi:hypothetical protein
MRLLFLWQLLMVALVAETGGVCHEDHADIVPYSTEYSDAFLFGPGCVGRVIEPPMVAVYLPGEHRTRLIGIATNRDNGLDLAAEKIVHVLGAMVRDIDTDFTHDPDGHRVDVTGRVRSGALDVEQVARGLTKNAFRQVAAAGVAGAEDKGKRLVHGDRLNSSLPTRI